MEHLTDDAIVFIPFRIVANQAKSLKGNLKIKFNNMIKTGHQNLFFTFRLI